MENYSDLLKSSNWHTKCIEILVRDNHKCSQCGKLGYHNSTTMTYDSAQQLDIALSDLTFDGKKISTYFDSLVHDEDRYFDIAATYQNHVDGTPYYWNDYYCPDIFVQRENTHLKYLVINTVIERNVFFRLLPNSEQPLMCNKIKGFGIKELNIKSLHCNNVEYNMGGMFAFPQLLSNKYVVTIQHINMNILGDDIIISISHSKFCLCLYLFPSDKWRNKIMPGLNVHHKYYINGNFPWEYDNGALITLCEECHKKTHQTHPTPIYRNIKETLQLDKYAECCGRCGGSGYLPHYKHIENGICFRCWGEGVIITE